MKHTLHWLLFAAIILSCSCTKESIEGDSPNPDPVTEELTHRVSEQKAISELNSVLLVIDGETRSGAPRSVRNICSVKASDVIAETRASQMPDDLENLVYIANFGADQGYAILAADDRLESVIAITERGNLTPEQFKAVADGQYDDGVEVPPVLPEVVAYATGLGGGGIIIPPGGGGGIIPPGGGGGGGGILPPVKDLDTGGAPPALPTYTRYGKWEIEWKRGPFLQMKWDQNAPYNEFCRETGNGNEKSPAGCNAVALGQIITTNYYNEVRKRGIKNFQKSINGTAIDWNTIFNTIDRYIGNSQVKRYFEYDNEHPYTRETSAVARLLKEIGLNIGTNYNDKSSGALAGHAKSFLERVGFQNVARWNYQSDKVFMMIVDRGLPVFARGDEWMIYGHVWVIDGILAQTQTVERIITGTNVVDSYYTQNRQLLHCNFGWAGVCDGYYYIHTYYNPNAGAVWKETDMDGKNASNDRNYAHDRDIFTYTGFSL